MRRHAVQWSDEHGGYIAIDPTRPGCLASGLTEDEALQALGDAIIGWEQAMRTSVGQPTLFEPGHDPSSKILLPLEPGVRGSAEFSACGNYRRLLTRRWGDHEDAPFALWIGMSPSLADAACDDPTTHRECRMTRSWGEEAYVKASLMDYRATRPDDLLAPGVVPSSPENLPTILSAAETATKVVLCYGVVPKLLKGYEETVINALRLAGHELWCLGRNGDGSPKHPLYLRSDTPLERFI
jgi:predicted RNase H-like HicB family nuclease